MDVQKGLSLVGMGVKNLLIPSSAVPLFFLLFSLKIKIYQMDMINQIP